jgi:hypothetical protein
MTTGEIVGGGVTVHPRRSMVASEGNHRAWSLRSCVRWARLHEREMGAQPPRFEFVCSFPALVHGPSVVAMLLLVQ